MYCNVVRTALTLVDGIYHVTRPLMHLCAVSNNVVVVVVDRQTGVYV